MYHQMYRNVCRFKSIDLIHYRNFSRLTSFTPLIQNKSSNLNQKSLNPKSTHFLHSERLIQNFILSQRHLSVSSYRLNAAAAGVSTAAVPEAVTTAAAATEAVTTTAAATEAVTTTEAVTNAAATTSETATETASSAVSPQELVLDFIPEKPTPIDPASIIGEPSFESLGLGSWWPTGRLQIFMEYLHIDIGLEWYQTIMLTALCMRLCTFPFVVMAQRNVANMNNNMPGMAALQEKMSDARKRGDMLESAQLGQQMQSYMKKKGINPLKNILPVMVQMPIFMSMFLGLRKMANLPVPSMEEGGLLWFENLTMADPFYLLPFMTSLSLYIQFRVGADGNRLETMGPTGRVLMTVFPFLLMPISVNLPCAITFYWLTTNTISVGQAFFLRIPGVRSKLGIPKLIAWNKEEAQKKNKKGFRASVRESIDNFRVQADIADRRALDEQAFKDAGLAKPTKTYAYDPSKPVVIKKNKY